MNELDYERARLLALETNEAYVDAERLSHLTVLAFIDHLKEKHTFAPTHMAFSTSAQCCSAETAMNVYQVGIRHGWEVSTVDSDDPTIMLSCWADQKLIYAALLRVMVTTTGLMVVRNARGTND